MHHSVSQSLNQESWFWSKRCSRQRLCWESQSQNQEYWCLPNSCSRQRLCSQSLSLNQEYWYLPKELQPSKAELPISVTESGILILAKELQPSKAELPISVTELGMVTFTIFVQSLKAALETFVTVWGIFTWQKACLQTALLVAASISFRLYMTVMSDSACNAASLSVWASFSKQLPCKTSTFRIFSSTGLPENFSRSIRFSCGTVSISLTSSVKTPPCKVFTCNSHRDMAAIGCAYLKKIQQGTWLMNLLNTRDFFRGWKITSGGMFFWESIHNSQAQLHWLEHSFTKGRSWCFRDLHTNLSPFLNEDSWKMYSSLAGYNLEMEIANFPSHPLRERSHFRIRFHQSG